MTYPQHKCNGIVRLPCEAQRAACKQAMTVTKVSRRTWWDREAHEYLTEAFSENLCADPAERQRMIDALRTKDDAELGRLVRLRVSPYLEHECDRAHDPEA